MTSSTALPSSFGPPDANRAACCSKRPASVSDEALGAGRRHPVRLRHTVAVLCSTTPSGDARSSGPVGGKYRSTATSGEKWLYRLAVPCSWCNLIDISWKDRCTFEHIHAYPCRISGASSLDLGAR